MTPAEAFYTALIALLAAVVAVMLLIVCVARFGIYVLVRLDRRHPRTEWEQLEATVTEGRADFWTPQALDRLRVAMENPHALDDPSTEYDFAAWKRELSDERGRRG